MVSDVVIVAAKRTPIGSFNGCFATVPAHDLASAVIKVRVSSFIQRMQELMLYHPQDLVTSTGVAQAEVSEVVLGQVLTAGQGQNPARQAAVAAGLPHEVPAMGVNMVCGSGLRAVAIAANNIAAGDSDIVVAGGMESMSLARHSVAVRAGVKMGDVSMEDTMIKDGLTDAFHKYHMGITAENVAKKYSLSREEQDAFAAESQRKAGAAVKDGYFKEEIVSVSVPGRKGATVVSEDEYPKPDTTLETLAKLRPAFIRDATGTVTAGNASGLNDGAAAVMLMSAEQAAARQLRPLARIVSSAVAGLDPALMGLGPVPAVRKCLARAGWAAEEVDLFELNEAFASQSLAVVRELGVAAERVNVCGGSIALGHPIGASGCRVLVTLLHAMRRRGAKRGCVALCIGGGMGIAMCVQAE